MAIQDFNQPYEILWNTDNEGSPVTVLIQNETHTITDNMIVLGQIPSESIGSKPTITGKYEVPLNSDLVSASYFKVDYKSGLIYFHNSLEGTTITINQYYGRGIRRLMASRVKLEDTNNHYASQTVEGALKEVYERVDNIITTPAGEITAQEIIDARKSETTLRNKIDNIDNEITLLSNDYTAHLADIAIQLADIDTDLESIEINKATKTEVTLAIAEGKAYTDTQVASVSDGTPEQFENIAAIQSAYPTGDNYVKLNLEDGYVYKWDSTTSTWIQGWAYFSNVWLDALTEQDVIWEVI